MYTCQQATSDLVYVVSAKHNVIYGRYGMLRPILVFPQVLAEKQQFDL